MKRILKFYYTEGVNKGETNVADVTFCCNQMRSHFDSFEFGLPDLYENEPVLMILGQNDNCININYCPFCGGKIVVKPSRLE
jgi:hypothetical protein